MKLFDYYKDNEAYCTQTEAIEFLQITPHTFNKYVAKFDIKPKRAGACCFYEKKEIEWLNNMLCGLTPNLIRVLEARTGKKIKFVDNDEN